MKVMIIGSSKLPIPAVKGGAVPNLIEQLIRQNEIEGELDLSCCALHDPEAEEASKKYKKTEFIWAKQPKWIRALDKALYLALSKIFHVKRLLSLSYLFQIIWMIFYVAKVLRYGNYDRVIFENSIPLLYSLKLWGNETKYAGRYYLHMHSVPRKYYGNAPVIRKSRKLICISQYVADAMANDKRLGMDADQICLMYNCIDTAFFLPQDRCEYSVVKEKYKIEQNKKIVLFIGRLCKEKGISELLQAVKSIERNDFVLLVLGSNFYKADIVSSYEKHLRTLANDMTDSVYFTGYIDYKDVPLYYGAADVIALPSMWDEPAGMTIIEAMACARPVITTRSGGIPEYTGEGNCILLERDANIVANLAENICKLLDDKEMAIRLSMNGSKRVEKYNMQFYYSQLLNILYEQ